LRDGEGKLLLKKALEPYLPAEIRTDRRWGSRAAPKWFRGPLREPVRKAVLGPVLAETGWFNEAYLRRWWTTTNRACAITARPCGPC